MRSCALCRLEWLKALPFVCSGGFPSCTIVEATIPSPCPTLCSGPVRNYTFPSASVPSLHPLRGTWRTMAFVRELPRYYGAVRLPGPYIAVVLLRFTARTVAPSTTISHRLSRFPREKLSCMLGVLDHAGPARLSRWRDVPCCLPRIWMASAPWIRVFSRLDIPACMSPVNAWPAFLRTPTHDSGPMRFATPSSYGTCTRYLSPVLTGAPKIDPPQHSAPYSLDSKQREEKPRRC